MPELADISGILQTVVTGFGARLSDVFLRPTSMISIWSLIAAGLLGLLYLKIQRNWKPSLRGAKRILLPKNYMTSRSAAVDWVMVLANHSVFPMLIATVALSLPMLSGFISSSLNGWTGGPILESTPIWLTRGITTLAMFLAYELAYYCDHRLSHEIPFLWEFHKVHHSAETLSPLTNYRVHPIDSLVFANFVAAYLAITSGVCVWLFGSGASPFVLDGVNICFILFTFTMLHLQHSQLWIVFPGFIGRHFIGPAHHQLHHSTNPDHFNCNYGSAITVFDRWFGSLRAPTKENPRLTFGVDGLDFDPHSIHGTMVQPFIDSADCLWGEKCKQNLPEGIAQRAQ